LAQTKQGCGTKYNNGEELFEVHFLKISITYSCLKVTVTKFTQLDVEIDYF
jgi:hypothetical protein